MAVLQVLLDTPAPRVYLDRQALLVDGRGWDLLDSTQVGIDAGTFTAMLAPAPMTADWQTSAAGIYRRYQKADYLLPTPDKWAQSSLRFDGDTYLENLNVNEIVTAGETFPRNRPMFLSWFAFNTGNENFIHMECGWGDPSAPGPAGMPNRSFRFWADGQVEVWTDDQMVGTLRISGDVDLYPQDGDLGTTLKMKPGKTSVQHTVDVMLIPCRMREMLLISNRGGPACHQYQDIDPADSDPTITQPGLFWWKAPSGKAKVQFAPLKFQASGILLQRTQTLRYAPLPGTGITPIVDAELPGYGTTDVAVSVVQADGVTPFVPDGTLQQARIRVDLTGDNDATPFVYWAVAAIDNKVLSTPNSPTDITPYLVQRAEPRLDVPESPSDVQMTLTMTEPAALEIAGATFLRSLGNRPLEASYGGISILTGVTKAPSWTEGISDEARDLVIETRDRWKHIENYLIQDPVPYDDAWLDLSIADLVLMCGFSSEELDIDPIDFAVPSVPQASQGEYANIPEVGDRASEWIRKFWENYAQTFWYGWYPSASGPVFRFKDPAVLPSTPAATLNASIYSTDAHGDPTLVFRKYKEINLEPEANSIYVIGQDPRTRKPIRVHYADLDSIDPTKPVDSRPANWLGEERRYSLVDPGITTVEDASYAVGVLASRLTVPRRMAEWEADFQFKGDGSPMWRGDNMQLTDYGIFRVNSLSAAFPLESTLGQWRPTTYTGEWVAAA